MMEEDLINRLLADDAVAGIAADRIAWGENPQGERIERIRLTKVSKPGEYTHGGPDALEQARIQVDCWARSQRRARQLAHAARAALEPPAVFGATRFAAGFLQNEQDFAPEDVDGTRVFRTTIDMMIWAQPAG